MVNIEIDGQKLEVPPGTMIIEAADHSGFRIPRFCYHKKLSIAANCRMCLVEVGNAPKPMPACATPVSEGMIVKTHSPKALEAQKAIMEFLLINHPLDCPICDQGGECELQDVALGYGGDLSRFSEGKRVVIDQDLGPLIATDMTRCIHCTRCVRFGTEIAGIRELGATGRGEHMRIGTFIEQAVTSELSGNVIDVCPVGALTSKPFQYRARAWELKQYPGIAPHDCLGSNIYWHTQRNQVMRVVPREQEAVNEVWLSDRDRFSYQGLNSVDRLTQPRIKELNSWQTACWEKALSLAANHLGTVVSEQGPDALAMLLSPSLSTEDYYLAQKVLRGLGSAHIDHRLHQIDFSDDEQADLYPQLGIELEALGTCDRLLLIGSDIQREQPLLSARLFQASRQGTRILTVNPVDYAFAFPVAAACVPTAAQLERALEGILGLRAEVSDSEKAVQAELASGQKISILLGALALSHPRAARIRALAQQLALRHQATLGVLTPGANAAGAWIAGAVPHRGPFGQSLAHLGEAMGRGGDKARQAFVLINFEPELDTVQSESLIAQLKQATCVIVITPYWTPWLAEYAHIVLPMAPVSETSGTFINVTGRWQTFYPACEPLGEARPLWKILRVLGNLLALPRMDYESREAVLEALKAEEPPSLNLKSAGFEVVADLTPPLQPVMPGALVRIAALPVYACDNMTRRAPALQAMQGSQAVVTLNARMSARLGLCPGAEVEVIASKTRAARCFPWREDPRVPDETCVLPRGLIETLPLGAPYEWVELRALPVGGA